MKHLKIVGLLIILISCASPAAAAGDVYIVKSGDSLWSIARQYNMLVSELKSLNNLSSDLLQVGQKLRIQSDDDTSQNNSSGEGYANGAYYVVKSGDCLWSIAQSHGISVEKLRKLNNLSDDSIYPGDKLFVGASAPKAPVEPEEEEAANQLEQEDKSSDEPTPSEENYDSQESSDPPSRAGGSALAGQILQTAAKHLGTPYRYGGSSPGGFDCSGFVMYVFSQYGIDLPRSASDQASVGTHIDKKDLKPGDLVFFNCGGKGINHAGIYSGNGNFIHSSSPRSGGVIYSSLQEGYYLQHYVGARRILR